MGLVLSSRDLTRFEAAIQALLSPLEHATASEWGDSVTRTLADMFRADTVVFTVPCESAPGTSGPSEPLFHVSIRGLEGRAADRLRVAVLRPRIGGNEYADPLLDRAMSCLAEAGAEVWNSELAEQLSGISSKEVGFFQEVFGRVVHQSAMGFPLSTGIAIAGVSHLRPAANPYPGAAGLSLLGMLLPAFKAGVHTLIRLEARRLTLAATLDHLGQALLIYDLEGQELHRSPELQRILAADPEAESLLGALRRLGWELGRARLAPTKAAGSAPLAIGQQEVRTRKARYMLRGGYVAAGTFAADGVVLVTLERPAPELPSAERLVTRYGLTRREAEVALLLAAGHSNARMAEALFVSPHTVRHHAQRVLEKLETHSRKALALRLLADLA